MEPPRASSAGTAPRLLDAWLPQFSVRERHERLIQAAPEETLRAVLRLPVAPDWIVRALFLLRGLGAGHEPIGEFASHNGFVALEQTATTFVFGMAFRLRGQPRFAATPEEWLAWSAPGVKIAADFRAHAATGGTRLSTETRVMPLDRTSAAVFRLYWLVVGAFSALIRRSWLRAVARSPSLRGGTPHNTPRTKLL